MLLQSSLIQVYISLNVTNKQIKPSIQPPVMFLLVFFISVTSTIAFNPIHQHYTSWNAFDIQNRDVTSFNGD